MTTAETLRAAAQYIREHGWIKRRHGCHGGPRCMAGAIMSVNGGTCSTVQEVVYEVTGCQLMGDFNDYHCETPDDAIAALLIAADLAEANWEGPHHAG